MIKFEKTSTLGRGNHIKVKKTGITIGWISKSQDGIYRYYQPNTNELNPTFTEEDLEVLKEKIKSRLS